METWFANIYAFNDLRNGFASQKLGKREGLEWESGQLTQETSWTFLPDVCRRLKHRTLIILAHCQIRQNQCYEYFVH